MARTTSPRAAAPTRARSARRCGASSTRWGSGSPLGTEPSSGTGAPPGVRLGVDVGSVRVGLAASDPSGLVASPVETVPRDSRGDADLHRIAAEVTERDVACVYVGLPRSLSGGEGTAALAARDYAARLARVVAPVPVRLVDERLSTVGAHQALHASGVRGRRHRKVVDQVAAVLVLQTALDAERASGRSPGSAVDPGPDPGGAGSDVGGRDAR